MEFFRFESFRFFFFSSSSLLLCRFFFLSLLSLALPPTTSSSLSLSPLFLSLRPPHRVPDPDADTEQHPPDHHHRYVHRPGAQRRPEAERDAREGDRRPAPGDAAKGAGEQRGDDAGDVEGRGEELQELVVVLYFLCGS